MTEPLQVHLDLEKIEKLAEAMELNPVLIKQKNAISKTRQKSYCYNAYHQTFVACSRLLDSIAYLNTLKLKTSTTSSIAHDFSEFLLHASIIVDSIKELAKIFELHDELESAENMSDLFAATNKKSCTDDDFFKLVRSLCFAHPCCTDNHASKGYHQKGSLLCCHKTIWTDLSKEGDLLAVVYSSADCENYDLHLSISSFERYLSRWIDFTEKITEAATGYLVDKTEKYKAVPIELPEEFLSYVEYLNNLMNESKKRTNDQAEWVLSDFIKIFQVTLTNEDNAKKLELYKEAIKLAVSYYHNRLQNMDDIDSGNTGILCPEPHTQTELIWEVHSPSYRSADSAISKRRYALSKTFFLDGTHSESDELFVRHLLDGIKDWVNQYVEFTNGESNEETLVLIALVEYFHALENDSLLNDNIPKKPEYRRFII